MRWPTKRAPATPWAIVDSAMDTDATRHVFDSMLMTAKDGWQTPHTSDAIDVEQPTIQALFGKHRVSTLIPTSAVRASQQDAFRSRLADIYGVQMRVESIAAEALTVLDDAGIDSRVLKGLASAELDYPARQFRQTGDVDLALRIDQFDAAVQALLGCGYRHHQTVNSDFLLKGVTLDAPNGVEVDLHTRLFQRSPAGDFLFEDAGEQLVDLPGVALCAEHRLVHAAGHFILTPPGLRRMSGLVDITRIRQHRTLDLDKARQFAATLGVEAITAAALRLESELARRGEADLAALGSWKSPGWADRTTRVAANRNLVIDHFNRFREVQRKDWLRYLPQWLVPDDRLRRKFLRSLRSNKR